MPPANAISTALFRRVKRAKGFAWEFRYYVRKRGKRHLKTQTFDGAVYKTGKALRQHLESFVLKLNETTEYARSAEVTFNALLRTSQSNRAALAPLCFIALCIASCNTLRKASAIMPSNFS